MFTTIDLEGDSPSASFSGGQFDHIFCGGPGCEVDFWGYGYSWEPGEYRQERLLSGYWADGTAFQTEIYEGHETHVTLHKIPEPGTLALLSLCGVLMRIRLTARSQ